MATGAIRIGLNAKRARTAWLFLAPSLLVLFAVALWPLGRTFLFSFTDAFLTEPDIYDYIGLENYFTLFEDPLWWQSVRNTLYFTVISVSHRDSAGAWHRAFDERPHFRPRLHARRHPHSLVHPRRRQRAHVAVDAA
jgi:hypothetical protein